MEDENKLFWVVIWDGRVVGCADNCAKAYRIVSSAKEVWHKIFPELKMPRWEIQTGHINTGPCRWKMHDEGN